MTMNPKLLEYTKFIANIFIVYLIVSAFGTTLYGIYQSGIGSLLNVHNYTPAIIGTLFPHQTSIRYVAYGYSILIFGSYLIVLYLKYRVYSLPLLLISYSLWDFFGILNGVYYQGGFVLPYLEFQIIAYLSLFVAIYLYKKKILIIKWSFPMFLIYYITNKTSIFYLIEDIWPAHSTAIFIFLAYIPFLLFTYYSLSINKKFPSLLTHILHDGYVET